MNKTGISCIWSIRQILEGKKWAYLWTFTFSERLPIAAACCRWQLLQRDLVRSVGFRGVRVYELHPGGHGLHIHLVTGRRHDVRIVREFSQKNGFGRIHVKPIPAVSADYVAKYLTKSKREPALKGRRLWSCLGFQGSRVKDVEIDSPISREMKKISDSDLLWLCESINCAVPASDQSKNFLRFLVASHRVATRSYRIASTRYPEPVEGETSPDLVLPPELLADVDRRFNDRVCLWLREKEERKNEKEGVPF